MLSWNTALVYMTLISVAVCPLLMRYLGSSCCNAVVVAMEPYLPSTSVMLITARHCGVAPLLSFAVPTIITVESSASMYVNSYLTIIIVN